MQVAGAKSKRQWSRVCMLAAILIGLAACLWWTSPIESLNRRVADTWFHLQDDKSASDVVLVLIDDRSLQDVGRWPWSRAALAELVDKIASQQPKAIGLDSLLSEAESAAA